MPEGDNLFKAAQQLHRALAGRVVTRFASPLPALKERGVEGHRVTRVRAVGKHAVIEFDDGRGFLSHLRMQGRWYVVEKALATEARLERFRREPRWDDETTSLIIENEAVFAVLERAAIAELLPLGQIERQLAELGPDLLSADYDPNEALERLRQTPQLTIAEALLRQSIVAGIGNVYKSEVLFLEKVSPFVEVATLDDTALARILKRARELLRRNLAGGPRRTTFGSYASDNHWVYERSGKHCLKCDTKIQMRRQGALQRSTYFCPECQGVNS